MDGYDTKVPPKSAAPAKYKRLHELRVVEGVEKRDPSACDETTAHSKSRTRLVVVRVGYNEFSMRWFYVIVPKEKGQAGQKFSAWEECLEPCI